MLLSPFRSQYLLILIVLDVVLRVVLSRNLGYIYPFTSGVVLSLLTRLGRAMWRRPITYTHKDQQKY